jgi:membrane-anchored protein YejM (alkaline phosphatase superfamily)
MYVPFHVGFNKFLIEKGLKNLDSTYFHNFKNENIKKTNKLISLFKDSSSKRFAYFHLTVPHEPYCFDANGNISLDKKRYYARQSKDYINSAKFASNLIQKIIDSFENSAAKNNTILIIQGDHGARVLDIPLTEEEKLSILDLVYIPNKKQINIKNKHTHVDEINFLIKTEFIENH